ncbi:hypothetical protein D3C84_653150 [compost metagenome]
MASALQVFIFSCCGVKAGTASVAAGVALRQLLMKALRSSPLRLLAVASALQVVILFCWSVAAKPWEHRSKPIISKGARSIVMECSPCHRTEGNGLALECRQHL